MTEITKVSLFGAMGRILTVLFTVSGGVVSRVTREIKTVLDFEITYGTTNRAPGFVFISARDLKVGEFLDVVPSLITGRGKSHLIGIKRGRLRVHYWIIKCTDVFCRCVILLLLLQHINKAKAVNSKFR